MTVFNCMTSFYGGLVIFSVLGFMAYEQGVPVGEVADKGRTLLTVILYHHYSALWIPVVSRGIRVARVFSLGGVWKNYSAYLSKVWNS